MYPTDMYYLLHMEEIHIHVYQDYILDLNHMNQIDIPLGIHL